jgi:hypothetical protein
MMETGGTTTAKLIAPAPWASGSASIAIAKLTDRTYIWQAYNRLASEQPAKRI